MTGKSYNDAFGLPADGFIHADCPHFWRYGMDGEDEAAFTARMAQNLEDTIRKEGPETIAGFFAEPVMGAGGCIPPSSGYFEAIQPILRRHEIPIIADEVITGFGRTGALWGSEFYGITPDAIVASKGITGGYFPMGAVILDGAFAARVMDASTAYGEFPHGFTSGGHPVGCAIALEAIRLIETELLDNVHRVAPRFQSRLEALEDHPHIGEARGIGLMGALEIVERKATKSAFDSALGVSERIARQALHHGLICRPLGQAVVLCPPFIITETEIDLLFDRLERTLSDVFQSLP